MGRFPRTPRTRCWYVHASVYGSWNRLCFCPVFHGTRAAPSTTGVGNFFSLVPVRPVLGTCTGPYTDHGIVCAFAMFSMTHVQLRPRRPSGTFFPCPRTARSRGPCKGPCTRRVPRTWFCPVFHGARQLPSTTAVGHFFPVSTYSPFTGPCTRRVPRTWFCPVFHVARIRPSPTPLLHPLRFRC